MTYTKVKRLLALAKSVGGSLVVHFSGEMFVHETADGKWVELFQGLSVYPEDEHESDGWEIHSEDAADAICRPAILIDGERITIAEAKRRAAESVNATN